MDDTIRWLLGNKDFQDYAAELHRARGVPLPANPGREFLVALREVDPQRFQALVQTPVAQLEQVRQQYSDNRARAEKINAALPAAKVAEGWKALPKGSRLRSNAIDPRVEAYARRAFAQRGAAPLPGLTAGETWMAYLHAVSGNDALRSDQALAELSAATGNVFGDAKQLRAVVDGVREGHETDSMVEAAGDISRSRDAELKRQRARSVDNPAYDPKRPPPGAITPKEKQRVDTRSTVAEIYDKTARPPRVTVSNRRELDDRQRKNEYAPAEHAEIDFAPELKRELIQELRDEKFIRDEYGRA